MRGGANPLNTDSAPPCEHPGDLRLTRAPACRVLLPNGCLRSAHVAFRRASLLIGALTFAIYTLAGCKPVEHVLVPEFQQGDLVVMDNLGAHKDARIKPLIEAAGARVIWLPSSSPDLNPIELAWAKVKR